MAAMSAGGASQPPCDQSTLPEAETGSSQGR